MKKLSLMVVGLLLTAISYSQDFSRIIQATKSVYKDEKWVTVDTQHPTDDFVIIKEWDVIIGSYKLKTYDDPEKIVYDDHTTYTWKAINKDGEKCLFMIKSFPPAVSSHVLYCVVYIQYSIMYEYECDK